MIMHHIVQGIFLIVGIVTLWASIFNKDWLFTAENARFVVEKFGRKGARWIYGTIGIISISAAIFFYYKIENMI